MTPLLKQYLQIKKKYKDSVLLFHIGDFYETFYEDAKIASETLDITLTSKPMGKGVRAPLAGIPIKAADSYIERFVSRNRVNYDYIYVITSDNSQRRVVDGEGVLFIPPQSFLEEIEACKKTLTENYLSSPSKSPIRISDCLRNEAKEKLESIRDNLS